MFRGVERPNDWAKVIRTETANLLSSLLPEWRRDDHYPIYISTPLHASYVAWVLFADAKTLRYLQPIKGTRSFSTRIFDNKFAMDWRRAL